MLDELSALAIVPKAKAIAARRLTKNEYESLARKRSVIEVTAALQAHPAFKSCLAGVSQTNLHRAQLEEALRKDVFFKYESLMRYSFRKGHFGAYFLMRCEIDELLTKLRLLSMGFHHHDIVHLPGFLADKTSFSLLALAKAETPAQCLPVLTGTPYAKVLQSVLPAQGETLDYLACEHAFETYYYGTVLQLISHDLKGAAAKDTRLLFLQQAEIYNLDMLYRAKAFFAGQFTPAVLCRLLLPYWNVLSQRKMEQLAAARDTAEFLRLYNASRAAAVYGERRDGGAGSAEISEQRVLRRSAERLIHFSSTPHTVLAALLLLCDIERSNIINIIEGVRYGLSPDDIAAFLKY